MNAARITSLQNPRVKQAGKLRQGRQRQKQGRLLIDGLRELNRALDAGVSIEEAFVAPLVGAGSDAARTIDRLRAGGAAVFEVTPDVYERLAYGERLEGIVAVAHTPRRQLQDISLSAHPLIAVVDRIEKPGNLGAILRSADAAGVDAVIASDAPGDLYSPNAIRASLGTIFTIKLCTATADEAITWLTESKVTVYAAQPDASREYTEADFRGPTAIVLGSEALGLSPQWAAARVTPIRLPMLGRADSLNVSTAAAVLFYEALRQRRSG